MDSIFKKHITKILEFEGGYVNDPLDTGGETNFGISKRAYPHLNIKNLTKAQVIDIYYKDYWHRAKCPDLPNYLKLMHFDTAVNSGISRANKILQKAIGTVSVDGILGPKTLAAAASITLGNYAIERCLFYAKIVRHKPSQAKFLVGWVLRVKKVQEDVYH